MIGFGAPCIDFVGKVEEDVLRSLPCRKGDSILVTQEQLKEALAAISSKGCVMLTGGCCANTVKGLASLQQKVSFCGKIGSDSLSNYFSSVFHQRGIRTYLSSSEKPIQQVVSLVTPDGQRSCYCYLGATEDFQLSDLHREVFQGIRLVYLEGYVLHHPGVAGQIIAYAREVNAKIALGLCSMTLVDTFKEEIGSLIKSGIDIVFCNQDEIRILTGLPGKESAELISRSCEVVVVTAGKEGCWVGSCGSAAQHAGYSANVVDTTGAGDLFVSGFLHGYLQNQPLHVCADWGNLLGSAVIETMGAEIPPERWGRLSAHMAMTAL